jgi:hypothetical protein
MTAEVSWVHHVQLYTCVLTDCCIHLLPEVDVSDGATHGCEGGRLPHAETIYRHKYAQAVVAKQCCNKRSNMRMQGVNGSLRGLHGLHSSFTPNILYSAGRLTVSTSWFSLSHATLYVWQTAAAAEQCSDEVRLTCLMCPWLRPRTLTINARLNYRFQVSGFKTERRRKKWLFVPFTPVDGYDKLPAAAFLFRMRQPTYLCSQCPYL